MSCLNAGMSAKVSNLASPLALPPSGDALDRLAFTFQFCAGIMSWLVTIQR